MKQKITDVAIEIMNKRGEEYIGYESFGLNDDVYFECLDRKIIRGIGSNGGASLNYPPNRQKVILAALDKDDRFEKYFILCCGGRDDVEARVRMFKLKTQYLNKESQDEN